MVTSTMMMDSLATILRPSSVSRDSHQGQIRNFSVIQQAIMCCQQQAGIMAQILYNQRNEFLTTNLYFEEDPGTKTDDIAFVTDDATSTTFQYNILGRAKPIARGDVYQVSAQLIDTPEGPATIVLPTAVSITNSSAMLGGNVTYDGENTLTAVGVVLSKTSVNSFPVLGGVGVTNITGVAAEGVFSLLASGLLAGLQYSFAPYATNAIGTTYGTVTEFTTLP